jgi:hypothetical protein
MKKIVIVTLAACLLAPLAAVQADDLAVPPNNSVAAVP